MALPPAAAETLYYDHAVYMGDVVNGKPHGRGSMDFASGQKYAGEWKNKRYFCGEDWLILKNLLKRD